MVNEKRTVSHRNRGIHSLQHKFGLECPVNDAFVAVTQDYNINAAACFMLCLCMYYWTVLLRTVFELFAYLQPAH